ncbi:MAG: type I-U CRISPR-associated protein Cas7 [Candidatus Schekmanbacteria bacterium]|nr:type I-U CRISPR-associated protein Cas7 [Candidatus Schekmanbacteria bacterium]
MDAILRRDRVSLPLIEVDFSEFPDIGKVSSLEAPHRIADAILRDSVDASGVKFRDTAVGSSFVDASPANATGLFEWCPTALVLGMWDSTGPKGGKGAKFPRAIASEIVGIDVQTGVRTQSRIDPLQIPLDKTAEEHRDIAAQTTLAALALCGAMLAQADGFDLRSRCLLVPSSAPRWELIGAAADSVTPFSLSSAEAIALLEQSVAAATAQGLRWARTPLTLQPIPDLVELVRKTRELAARSVPASV